MILSMITLYILPPSDKVSWFKSVLFIHPDRMYWADSNAPMRMLQQLSEEIHDTCPTNTAQIKLEKITEEVK